MEGLGTRTEGTEVGVTLGAQDWDSGLKEGCQHGSPQNDVRAPRSHAAPAQDRALGPRGGRRRLHCAGAAPPLRRKTNGLEAPAPGDAGPAPWRRAAAEPNPPG